MNTYSEICPRTPKIAYIQLEFYKRNRKKIIKYFYLPNQGQIFERNRGISFEGASKIFRKFFSKAMGYIL